MQASMQMPWPSLPTDRLYYRPGSGSGCGGGSRKELLQKTISRSLEQAINDRITYQAGKDEKNVIQLVDEELEGITAQVIAPIICEGDCHWFCLPYEPGTKGTVWRDGNEAGSHCRRISGTADGKLRN